MKTHSFEKLNFTVHERLFHRHWSSGCEPFASGDALLTLLDHHWQLSSVTTEFYPMSSWRHTVVHVFTLSQGSDTLHVPVVSTPAVQRLAHLTIQKRTRVHQSRAEV
jgi:hypothetical protein